MRETLADDSKQAARLHDLLMPTPTAPYTSRERMMDALRCSPVDRPPVWLMRQAGRCLPEYRALKEKYSFRQLIQIPDLAAEVTLQPIRRFHFDAAIIFSDILVVPEALGHEFKFRDTGGVVLDTVIKDRSDIHKLDKDGISKRLQYVAKAIRYAKLELARNTALLGFAGAPWTLASFILEGGSSHTQTKALELFRSDRTMFDELMEALTRAVIEFLQLQVSAGVDAVQIFDSLGGLLPAEDYEEASGKWIRSIVTAISGRAPTIVFGKGVRNWTSLITSGAQALGIDHEMEMADALKELPANVAIQGNLAPDILLAADPKTVTEETSRLLEVMRGRPGYIFNLGHGVPPEAKLENLDALVKTVQNFK